MLWRALDSIQRNRLAASNLRASCGARPERPAAIRYSEAIPIHELHVELDGHDGQRRENQYPISIHELRVELDSKTYYFFT